MTESHSAFIGEIPRNYEKYLGPLVFNEYVEDLVRRITVPKDGQFLEIAAGTGLATRKLRDSISQDVDIVATDLNEDMLNVAKGKFEDSENIEFKIANALDLPFDEATFDVVACQFSLMFFADKLVALKEAARVLKPGGKFYFNIWDSLEHNYLAQLVHKIIEEYFPDNSPDFFNVPFGYYEIDIIKKLLFEAGFADIEISVLPRISAADEARDVAMGYIMGSPLRLQIEQRDPESLAKVVDAVEYAVGKEFGYKTVKAKMQAIIFTAHYE